MSTNTLNKPRIATIAGMILMAAAFRIVPHPPNFSPVAAIALFGGACLADRRIAFVIPLAAMVLGDLVLGFSSVTPVIYASFAATVCIGFRLRSRRGPVGVVAHTLAASVMFYLTTNAAVWILTDMYPHTGAGLAACYVAALPFFHNTLLGDLGYSSTLFLGLAIAERRFPALTERAVPA